MSDSQHHAPGLMQQFISTAILFVLGAVMVVIFARLAGWGPAPGGSREALSEAAVADRIQPVGNLKFTGAAVATEPRAGEVVYQQVCSACHAAAVNGAPKFGDAAAWAPRLKTGFEALLASALKGKGNMPPQAGAASELEVARGVVYMANKAGGKFDEPKAPAAAASAAK